MSVGHRKRVKEKFLKQPLRLVADYELLELLLFYTVPRIDTKPLAKELMSKYGSLAGVLNADSIELRQFKSAGDNMVLFFKILSDMFSRLHIPIKEEVDILSNWSSVLNYCQLTLGFKNKEYFRILLLNKKNALIGDEIFDGGTVDKIQIYPREIARKAIEVSASAVILVHNHPSGDSEPSREDVEATNNIAKALEHVGVKLHDHLIVSKFKNFSFKAAGLLG